MLVVCPKCFTQYVVPDEHQLPEGQKFHCSACHHYFYLNSGGQNGFYGNETGESDIIPTVTSVMTKTNEQVTIQQHKAYPIHQTVPAENHLNIKPADIYAESPVSVQSSPEPMSLLANESPQSYDRLDSLPEEFKPVTQEKKKTSLLSLTFWLCVAGGICYFAYVQKDFLIQQIDEHIIGVLDEKYNPTETQKMHSSTQDTPFVEKKEISVQQTKPQQNTIIVQEIKTEPNQITIRSVEPQNKSTVPTELKTVSSAQTEQLASKEDVKPIVVQTEKNTQEQPIVIVEKKQEPLIPAVTENAEKGEKSSISEKEPQTQEVAVINEKSLEIQAEISSEPIKQDIQTLPTEVPVVEKTNELNQVNEPQQEKPITEDIADKNNQNQERITVQQSVPVMVHSESKTPAINSEKQESDNDAKSNNQPEDILLSGETAQPIVIRETVKLSNSYTDLEPVSSVLTEEANRILKIQDVSYEISENEAGVERLLIKGVVANTELEKTTIPELKAVVYNAEDMVIARKRIILSQPEIEGNATQEFFSSVVPSPEGVNRVEVLFDE